VTFAGDQAAQAYASAPSYPIGTDQTFALTGSDSLVAPSPGEGTLPTVTGSFTTPSVGAPESQTEESGVSQTIPLSDPPGTFVEYESAPLTQNLDVVGIPTVDVSVQVPSQIPSLGLYFKLEDIAPDGTVTLPDRLIAPARFPIGLGTTTITDLATHTATTTTSYAGTADVTLPGIVHEFPAGDRIALVIAGSDSAYSLASPGTSVTMTSSGQLTLPVAGANAYGPLADTAKR